jgi:hypothetical protein
MPAALSEQHCRHPEGCYFISYACTTEYALA